MAFPRDDYTPFGYLANPYHRARSWTETEAGLLRSTDDALGFGWVEPTARRPSLEAAVIIAVEWNGRLYQTRSDFARLGYRSCHHSSLLFSYDWEMDRVRAVAEFALAGRDGLVSWIRLANAGAFPASLALWVLVRLVDRDGRWKVEATGHSWLVRSGVAGRLFGFAVGESRSGSASTMELIGPDAVATVLPGLGTPEGLIVGYRVELSLPPGEESGYGAGLARGSEAAEEAPRLAREAAAVCCARRVADDRFYARAALPVGDWPAHWRRGWVYDLETTRATVFPARGIFRDVWLSWMISWPRVVVAEGTLDALRLSYAAPELALRTVRTLLVDAPAPNVPCVFEGGEPNMVARDGTICGTSPAWCLPFHNLWLLYCRTVDRRWLAEVFPRLEAYLEYWLRERVDEEGWIVYRCTWEAGEDCTPRLDPSGSGDAVISRNVRPIELQAAVSYSAAILARFARELGEADRLHHWEAVAQEYARRTQQLWDPSTGRYRDWDRRTGRFLEASGDPVYWRTDPGRFSALSLIPLVAGLASVEQRDRLRAEIDYYNAPPWCLWPSWSYVVAEAATAAGWHDVAGRFAWRIVDRVYRQNDRRSLEAATRPTPGTAPEFWPLDLAEFDGSDGYGWGATTTLLWIRQIFGFLEGADLSELSFVLAPNLPEELLIPGRRYGFQRLPYRGIQVTVLYEVASDGVEAVVQLSQPLSLHVVDGAGRTVPVEEIARGASRFKVAPRSSYRASARNTQRSPEP